MSENTKELNPIPPNPPRWKPSINPALIIVTGLDTTASVNDQIDQIDQLITLKLQVHPTDGF
jgi:DASH complex subunit ASK1